MKSFIMAALSWILAGIAVAIICAGTNVKVSKESEKTMEKHIAAGAVVGLVIGVVANNFNLWENDVLGIAVAALWGMAAAVLWSNRKSIK